VEEARKDLLAAGFSGKKAAKAAPAVADARRECEDERTKPFSWLGAPTPGGKA
jgi:hypothetical protein